MKSEHHAEMSQFPAGIVHQNGSATVTHLSTIPVCIVSDSCLLREGLAQLIAPYLTLKVLHATAVEPVGFTGITPVRGQVIIIDCAMGWMAIQSWVEHCRSLASSVYIMLLQMPDDVEMILSAIEAGAHSYALQNATTEDIAHIIRVTYNGGAICSPHMIAQLFARMATRARSEPDVNRVSPLTPRETQILGYIAQGYSNKEIAVKIVVTVRTVKFHVHNILRKLDVPNRHAAVRLAYTKRWLK